DFQKLAAGFEPVAIDVIKRQPPAAIFVNQRESGTRDFHRDAEAVREAFHELRLARAEIAGERKHIAPREAGCDALTELESLARAMRNDRSHRRVEGRGSKVE